MEANVHYGLLDRAAPHGWHPRVAAARAAYIKGECSWRAYQVRLGLPPTAEEARQLRAEYAVLLQLYTATASPAAGAPYSVGPHPTGLGSFTVTRQPTPPKHTPIHIIYSVATGAWRQARGWPRRWR